MAHYILSDIGVVRSENQDKAAVFEAHDVTFAILCDGMGGHNGGRFASEITIKTMGDEFKKKFPKVPTQDKIAAWFEAGIKKSTKEMKDFAKRDPALMDMGTTVTAAIVSEGKLLIFNVGDSRTYVYNGLLHQVTIDHNLMNHYVDKFGYTPEEAAQVRGAAALTSALGPKKRTNIENFMVPLDDNIKYIILTSDGIHDYITKPMFEKIIGNSRTSLEKKSAALIKNAIKGKSADNLTIAIVEVE